MTGYPSVTRRLPVRAKKILNDSGYVTPVTRVTRNIYNNYIYSPRKGEGGSRGKPENQRVCENTPNRGNRGNVSGIIKEFGFRVRVTTGNTGNRV